MAILEVKSLRKAFGSVVAVEEISFSVDKGEVFTIIGPNGEGKTTTLEMIEGLQVPDRGDIKINGLTWQGGRSDQTFDRRTDTVLRAVRSAHGLRNV